MVHNTRHDAELAGKVHNSHLRDQGTHNLLIAGVLMQVLDNVHVFEQFAFYQLDSASVLLAH
jgi:hypothetical protein